MATGDQVADYARTQLGKPYVWATAGPDTFDCSGFTHWAVLQITGVSITRSSVAQASLGVAVVRGDERRGDIMLFDTMGDGTAQHVGFYDGYDPATGLHRMTNALNETAGCVVSDPFSSYFNPIYLGARRLWDNLSSQTTDGSTAPPVTATAMVTGALLTVIDGPVNLRPTAGISGTPVASMPTGQDMVQISSTSTTADGYTWWNVRTRHGDGWVAGSFVAAVASPVNHVANPSATVDLTNIVAVAGSTLAMATGQVRVTTSATLAHSGINYKGPSKSLLGPRWFVAVIDLRGGGPLDSCRLHSSYSDGLSGVNGAVMATPALLSSNLRTFVYPMLSAPSGRTLSSFNLYVRKAVAGQITFNVDNARIYEV